MLRRSWDHFAAHAGGAGARRARGVSPSRPSARVARRLVALRGAQARFRRPTLDGLGATTSPAAIPTRCERASGELDGEMRYQTLPAVPLLPPVGARARARAASAASASWATCPIYVVATTPPTSGRTRSSSSSTRRPAGRRSPACRRTTSRRPASSGATRSTTGTAWRRTATPGGSSGSRPTSRLCDLLRIDHFRAFSAYWAVPAGRDDGVERPVGAGSRPRSSSTRRGRRWASLPIVAEDLGDISDGGQAAAGRARHSGDEGPAVRASTAPTASTCRTATPRTALVYTGTHDNDTAQGWYASAHARGARARLRLSRLGRPRESSGT